MTSGNFSARYVRTLRGASKFLNRESFLAGTLSTKTYKVKVDRSKDITTMTVVDSRNSDSLFKRKREKRFSFFASLPLGDGNFDRCVESDAQFRRNCKTDRISCYRRRRISMISAIGDRETPTQQQSIAATVGAKTHTCRCRLFVGSCLLWTPSHAGCSRL